MKYLVFLLLLPFFSSGQIIISIGGGGSSLGDGGPATAADIDDPCYMVFSKEGYLYISSADGNRIRKIDTCGIVTTVAGTGVPAYSGDHGPATAAQINEPEGIALDSAGNIYFSEGASQVVRRVDITTGIITTVCGTGVSGYSGDNGPATAAQINGPEGICFDRAGNLYLTDNTQVVRKINTLGIITTFAGTGVAGYNGDGIQATAANLYYPTDVTADDLGNVYISDQGNCRIRKVNSSGIISTIAGNGAYTYIGDGMPATDAQFLPNCIHFDRIGNYYIFGHNGWVFKVDTAGIFHRISGNGTPTCTGDGGPATAAAVDNNFGAVDKCGNLILAEVNCGRIREIIFDSSCMLAHCLLSSLLVPSAVAAEISVYPNPAYDVLQIDNVKSPMAYRIYNMTGVEAIEGKLMEGNNSIPLRQLPAGIYVLELADGRGVRTMKKIVKE